MVSHISGIESQSIMSHELPTDTKSQVKTLDNPEPIIQKDDCENSSSAERKLSNLLSASACKRKIEAEIQEDERAEKKPKRDEDGNSIEIFSKKGPQLCFRSKEDESAKQLVSSVIESLRNEDQLLGRLLDAWYTGEMQNDSSCPSTLLDALSKELDKGTCYGQTTKIIELVTNHDRETITEEWISAQMNMRDAVRYQILQALAHFVRHSSGAYVYGVHRASAAEKIALKLPFQEKKGIESEVVNFKDIDQDILVGRLSDFIKNDIRGNSTEYLEKDYIIKVTLLNAGELYGHATIMYYSSQQKRYFWYDPSIRHDGGLFSTNDHKTFLCGAAEKIAGWKEELKSFRFSAYHI